MNDPLRNEMNPIIMYICFALFNQVFQEAPCLKRVY